MVEVNLKQWPLVVMEIQADDVTTTGQEYVDQMDSLLAHAEKHEEQFGLVIVSKTDSNHAHKEANQIRYQWIRGNRSRIANKCIAVAMVTKSDANIQYMKKPIVEKIIMRQVGAPGDVFVSVRDAKRWVSSKIETIN